MDDEDNTLGNRTAAGRAERGLFNSDALGETDRVALLRSAESISAHAAAACDDRRRCHPRASTCAS